MNIKLTCKLLDSDTIYFLDPLLQSDKVENLYLFRNSNPVSGQEGSDNKLKGIYYSGIFKLVIRMFRMIRDTPIADLYVGIYEIPHGILALFAAMFHRKPAVICIIGNPKHLIRNNGLRGFITQIIYRKADALTVTGSESKNYLVDHKGLFEDKIFILPNSIPIDSFNNLHLPKDYDLITMGRLSPEKGLFNLLDIISLLKKKLPEIKLGIAGKGPFKDELKARIQEQHLEKNVDLLGFVENATEFLNRGKMFITTSYTEGLPRTAIQSMACGTPVVASNVGDMIDLVKNGETGILISDPSNIELFTAEVYNLLVNNKLREQYELSCYKFSRERYSHSAAKKAWENVIQYLQ